jgi:hypothetical protein
VGRECTLAHDRRPAGARLVPPGRHRRLLRRGYTSFGATYARSFTDKFSAGANINLVRMGLAEYKQETITFDLGTLYDVGVAGMKIGFAIQNIGGQVQFIDREARVPTVFRVGTSADIINTGSSKLLGSFEFSHPPDNAERANVGAE